MKLNLNSVTFDLGINFNYPELTLFLKDMNIESITTESDYFEDVSLEKLTDFVNHGMDYFRTFLNKKLR